MRVYVISMFFMLLLADVFAQSASVQLLPEVSVEAQRAARFAAGAKIVALDSIEKEALRGQHLTDLVSQMPGMAIRSYGSGMIGSLSFRGTGANHTRIMWNGINLNQPTLGQTDLSLVPLAAVEDVQIQYGGAGALQGSDALGGVLYLHSAIPSFTRHLKVGLSGSVGSFQTYHWLAKAQGSNGKWFVQAKAYRHQSANTFTFMNTTKVQALEEVQENARWYNQGANVDAFRSLGRRTLFSIKSWYHQTDRQIQPSMVINGRPNQYTRQWDEALRTVAELSVQANPQQLHTASLAQVYDYLWYNQRDRYFTYQWVGNYHLEQQLGEKYLLRAGATATRIRVESDGFLETEQELRTDAYASLSARLSEVYRLSANIRQTLLDGYQPSPTPSLGMEANWAPKGNWQWTSRAQVARSYRLPTFNERYWPTGNPNIRPENGYSAELGTRGVFSQSQWLFETELSLYASRISDWVIWQNSSLGSTPANIQKVSSQGLEWTGQIRKQTVSQIRWQLAAHYAFTQATIRSEGSNYGNQLPYVPYHAAGLSFNLHWDKWDMRWGNNYTGYRFYSASNDGFVAPYVLSHLQLGYSYSLGSYATRLSLRVDNLWDVAYQNIRYMAMPGRSFTLHYQVFFHQNQ